MTDHARLAEALDWLDEDTTRLHQGGWVVRAGPHPLARKAYCVGGATVMLAGCEPLFGGMPGASEYDNECEATVCRRPDGQVRDIFEVARDLLDLKFHDAELLFFGATDMAELRQLQREWRNT